MENVYTLYDEVAGVHSAPFIANTDLEAKRILLDMVMQGNNLVSQHKEDYSLFRCGQFDKYLGCLNSLDVEKVISALDVYNEFRSLHSLKDELDNNSISDLVS